MLPENHMPNPQNQPPNHQPFNEEAMEKNELDLPMDKLMMHVRHYKTQIISQLRSAVIATGKSVQSGEVKNIYNVQYQGKRASKLKALKSAEELVCSAGRQVKIRAFLKNDTFFKKHQLDEFLPKSQLKLFHKGYDSCGVVSSAGSLLHSKLGKNYEKKY